VLAASTWCASRMPGVDNNLDLQGNKWDRNRDHELPEERKREMRLVRAVELTALALRQLEEAGRIYQSLGQGADYGKIQAARGALLWSE
jgi:hypothetical protein